MDNFAEIYQEFHPKIHRYLRNLCGEADAADLTQAVFLKVSQALDGFREESSLATWIYRIATNTAHDHASSALSRQRGNEQPVDENSSLDDFPDSTAPGTEREYIRREMNACIRGVAEQLPETLRTVLILSEFEELSNTEIADILGININTVKIRLHRARTALREAMTCQCNLYHDDRNELMCDRKG